MDRSYTKDKLLQDQPTGLLGGQAPSNEKPIPSYDRYSTELKGFGERKIFGIERQLKPTGFSTTSR